jgi:hypothetical protein
VYRIYSELDNPPVLSQDGKIFPKYERIFHRIDSSLIGKGMAYKNVHKRVTRLADLHLIEEFDYKYPGTHGAKYYKITDKGIFYLIYSSRTYPDSLRLENLIRYHGDPVLETILFPYFEDKSLTRYTFTFLYALSSYLAECCGTMLGAINGIKEEDQNEKKKNMAMLKYDLKRKALSLSFELVTKFKPAALGYLAGDKKFVKLAKELKIEFDSGYDLFYSDVTKRTKLGRKKH